MPKNNAQRDAVLERLEAAGVVIPLWDGVLIDPQAEIAAGVTILPGCVIRGATTVGAGSVIGPDSYLEDAVIGERCIFKYSYITASTLEDDVSVGPFSQVRPGSLIRAGVKIGDFVEIKNSTVGAGTKVAHLTYLGDTDCGAGVNFGCGVVTVNYNGRGKYRTAIGDGAFVGCNANLIAPVEVGADAYIAAGATVTQDVPAGALCIARARQENKEGYAKRFLDKDKA